jgi:hypothetical protein
LLLKKEAALKWVCSYNSIIYDISIILKLFNSEQFW